MPSHKSELTRSVKRHVEQQLINGMEWNVRTINGMCVYSLEDWPDEIECAGSQGHARKQTNKQTKSDEILERKKMYCPFKGSVSRRFGLIC